MTTHGLLRRYRGDGIWRKLQHFGAKTEVICWDLEGRMIGGQHLEADLAGNLEFTASWDSKYENMASMPSLDFVGIACHLLWPGKTVATVNKNKERMKNKSFIIAALLFLLALVTPVKADHTHSAMCLSVQDLSWWWSHDHVWWSNGLSQCEEHIRDRADLGNGWTWQNNYWAIDEDNEIVAFDTDVDPYMSDYVRPASYTCQWYDGNDLHMHGEEAQYSTKNLGNYACPGINATFYGSGVVMSTVGNSQSTTNIVVTGTPQWV
jgi:hypothetical protein